jgi:hypothetical protein
MIAINKIVLLIIFLIILAAAFYMLFGISSPIGDELNLQNQLRQCCLAFRASGCDDISVICNEETMESFGSIAIKLNMNGNDNSYDLAKDFCGCP